MSELVQFIVVVAFGAFCFGCGYLTASIVTRNKWRAEMIRRGVARYNWQTGKWEWGGWLLPAAPHRTSRVLDSFGGSPTMSTIYSALLVMLRY